MELMFIYLFCIAFCSASKETTQESDGDAAVFLEDLVRRLTQTQMQTTQKMLPQLPQLRMPVLASLMGQKSDESAAFPPFKYPFQSNFGRDGAHSFASSSVSVKRPHESDSEVDAKAVAYASVKDVNTDEHIGESFDSSGSSSTDSEHKQKSTTKAVDNDDTMESTSDISKKTGPYSLKQQQTDNTVIQSEDSFSDIYFVAIVAGCCAVGIFGVISAGFCFYKLQKSRKAAADVDYPAYGVTGPSKDLSSPNGDRKLAQSAQMYHYQHQKQQMIAVEKAGSTKNTSASDVDSEEENEEGDYTVYECPGLAPTGEMEVKNPLFHDDSTPVSPPVLPAKSDSNQNN